MDFRLLCDWGRPEWWRGVVLGGEVLLHTREAQISQACLVSELSLPRVYWGAAEFF